MNKKSEVSKGLRSLLNNIEKTSNPTERNQLVRELSHNIIMINPDNIEVNPFQPRTEFDQEQLEELSRSIKSNGLIQPITVRSVGGNKYQLISGERRLRASKIANLKEIPAYIRVANDQEMLEMALVENIQRADLNAIEVAISYQRLMEECNLTHDALSDRVGKDRSTVTNYVRLLKLPPQIQSSVKNKMLSMGHARTLAGIEDPVLQLRLHQEAIEKQLSVRALESLAKSFSQPKSQVVVSNNITTGGITPEVKKIKDKLSHHLGQPVDIKRATDGSGSIIIRFNSDDDFNNIIDSIIND
ncbi:MAG TPA: ParB/RepB/Spo0J family partition protein [Saprospiraceae bacterium]|jgi:ParB family chromosome partitioning protein|nr:ParB/RepB/Spo0J family partition protein [Saprospiraceae bacterium]HRO07253.1 ParB/RepB/Spo0J family partition protein [Saprospiraceae bacterium]HRP40536.1 ParB/RepB/Spo0J family partition protein [Saprospiraceae bacterium]